MVPSAITPTKENYDERAYLQQNPDVRAAVGVSVGSGWSHFLHTGMKEGRKQVNPKVYELRRDKNIWLQKLLKRGYDKPFYEIKGKFNHLTPKLKEQFDLIDTPNVSSHDYDKNSLELIKKYPIVLDCGAGYRNFYYPNVVNFEIVDYPTTDVLGVGEKLPFKDNSFDAVISIAVLEHVKDPFQCAREITRVLRPGGKLYCAVPFLQPFHGYPHHYFNMTKTGLKTLFENGIKVDKQEVVEAYMPIYALCWIVGSWGAGLDDKTREEFLNMRLKDFFDVAPNIKTNFNRPFVHNLSEDKNFELATGTVLFGTKQ